MKISKTRSTGQTREYRVSVMLSMAAYGRMTGGIIWTTLPRNWKTPSVIFRSLSWLESPWLPVAMWWLILPT